MINVKKFILELKKNGISFYTGVPDSVLKSLINFLSDKHKNSHLTTTSEGSAVSLGIGYNLATKKIPLIYLQNSGIGNALNPIYSFADKRIYSIPMVLLIGRRGFPKHKDEPQHYRIGETIIKNLETFNIKSKILSKKNYVNQIKQTVDNAKKFSKAFALIVPMNFFEKYEKKKKSKSKNLLKRYEFLKFFLQNIDKKDVTISSLGNVSRELFVLNERFKRSHKKTLYTIGAMGHANQIGLSISNKRKQKRTFILDGDGSVQMHLGNILSIGKYSQGNLTHIIFNNGLHESTGSHNLVNKNFDYKNFLKLAGYSKVFQIDTLSEFRAILKKKIKGLNGIIINIDSGTINNLPRPTKKPNQLKKILEF